MHLKKKELVNTSKEKDLVNTTVMEQNGFY